MKYIIYILTLLVLVSTVALTQIKSFHATEVIIQNVKTKEIRTVEVDVNIIFSKYDVIFVELGRKITFNSGDALTEGDIVYRYGKDDENIECVVLFQELNGGNSLIGIAYSDAIFVYSANLLIKTSGR